jgi:hypothetical protein
MRPQQHKHLEQQVREHGLAGSATIIAKNAMPATLYNFIDALRRLSHKQHQTNEK